MRRPASLAVFLSHRTPGTDKENSVPTNAGISGGRITQRRLAGKQCTALSARHAGNRSQYTEGREGSTAALPALQGGTEHDTRTASERASIQLGHDGGQTLAEKSSHFGRGLLEDQHKNEGLFSPGIGRVNI